MQSCFNCLLGNQLDVLFYYLHGMEFHMIAIENIFLFFLTMISVSYAIMYMYTAHSIIWTDLL